MYIGTYVPIILDEIESETGKNHPKKAHFLKCGENVA
jgi:hypothetical protein